MFDQVFERTVSALCYTLAARYREPELCNCVFGENEAVNFVLRECRRSPDFVRGGIRLATLLLCCSSFLSKGQFFYQIDATNRVQLVERWRKLRFPLCRQLIGFYDALMALGWQDAIARQQDAPNRKADLAYGQPAG